jgi:hypothetical protein
MDTKLGIGLATGMFYHAPAGTALPTYPAETLSSSWTEIGDVTADGITLATDKSTEVLRNWANVVKRIVLTEHTETIQSPIMDTTEEALKAVVGSDNVTTTAATSSHGALVKVNLSAAELPEEEAFLWLMKDGDDMIAIGCTRGQVTAVDNVAFAPGSSINWTPTITALGEGFELILDDGITG